MHKTEKTIRVLARILSLAILLLWGYFLIAHLVGEQGSSSRPLATSDYISLATMLASLAGLALAWKWELVGATVTLAAIVVVVIINWRVLVFPKTLIPVNAILFLSCWWMSRTTGGQLG